jgi:hypothetical protein
MKIRCGKWSAMAILAVLLCLMGMGPRRADLPGTYFCKNKNADFPISYRLVLAPSTGEYQGGRANCQMKIRTDWNTQGNFAWEDSASNVDGYIKKCIDLCAGADTPCNNPASWGKQ